MQKSGSEPPRKTPRRDFLKQSGAGVAALAGIGWSEGTAAQESPRPVSRSEIPPHRPLIVPGVYLYADRQSAAPGEEVSFHVSSTIPYHFSVCRLGLKVDDPAGDGILHRLPRMMPIPQAIHPGSYIHVERGLAGPIQALSIECWLRPARRPKPAVILGQLDRRGSAGFGLLIEPPGTVSFYLGDGGDFREPNLHLGPESAAKPEEWRHVVATWDGAEKSLWIDGRLAGRWPFSGPAAAGDAPLRIGAAGEGGHASLFFDGDIAAPALYAAALSQEEIESRFRSRALGSIEHASLLAAWPLSEERGDRVADASPHGHHGRIINHATWMIGGPSFRSDVARFGGYDPAADPERSHALRLASDDLYDCRWMPIHRFKIPESARSGFYAGRIEYEIDGKPYLGHATFIVRKNPRAEKAPVLLLAATNTWRAYNAAPFGVPRPGMKQLMGTDGLPNSPGDPPAFSFYRNHAGGQGTYQVGLRMPWPAGGPYVLYGGPTDYSHLMRADRFAQVWLEREGYRYDVAADLDLHRDPEQLDGYRAFVINGHSEYWSIPMVQGLERYLKAGGNAIVLSGNSLFWRVSFNDEGTILECRKVDAPGEQLPPSRRGECWHSHDGRRGGLLRECGHPGWKLIGLETLGWNNQGDPAQFGPYRVADPDYFLFRRPEDLGLQRGDPIGQGAAGGLPRANGHEIDVRLSTLSALQEKSNPPGVSVPADPPGIRLLANGEIAWKRGGAAFDYFFRPVRPATDQGGEMIYWERPDGGRVFNAGSIGAGWALEADPKFQGLLRNVLAHFGVRKGGG